MARGNISKIAMKSKTPKKPTKKFAMGARKISGGGGGGGGGFVAPKPR